MKLSKLLFQLKTFPSLAFLLSLMIFIISVITFKNNLKMSDEVTCFDSIESIKPIFGIAYFSQTFYGKNLAYLHN